ncbi:hypothetical protein D3C72_2143960 [compost metagenome]
MPVLGTIIDQQENAGAWHLSDQHIEEGLGLAIQPLQVLEHQHQRMVVAIAHQQICDGIKDASASDARVHRRQCRARFDDAQQVEQVRQAFLQRAV